MYGINKSRCKYKIVIQYNLLNSFHSSSSNTNQCYYKTLGIVRNASDKDIRTAYIQMAKKFHPDVNTQTDSTAKFTSINEAYSILSDKMKKHKYDTKIGNYYNNNTQQKSPNKNWWDFNFYGNNQSNNNPNTNTNSDDDYNDFEFTADFYGDFSRFNNNNNNNNNSKNRKRKRDIYEQFEYNKTTSKNNPYADYYYYYQQQIKNNNNNNNNNNNKPKYENIWTDFEFDFDVENEFETEFNNDAFWRFLRNNNKKHRTKQNKNENNNINDNNNNNKKNNKNNKEKIKIKKENEKKQNSKQKNNEKEKDKERENEPKTKKSNNKNSEKETEISHNDISINLELDFLEASLGCTKSISFNRNEICIHCGGTSYDKSSESMISCIKCDGKGLIYGYGNDFLSHKCINCSGNGYIFKKCINCSGKSIISISKSLTITIPSGIRNNDRVRVSKQGHEYVIYNNNNSSEYIIKYGHIWINCNILCDKYFIRINNDIHITMNIPYVLAVLGGSFVVPTIYGPNIIKILSGINTNDYEILENKGIYDSSTNKKGNQYIHFNINIPQINELNQQQKQLLNQYAKLEKSPNVIKTVNNLKHFKKYGKKVQTYNENNNKSNYYYKHNDDDDDDDDINDNNNNNDKENINNDYLRYNNDVDIDDDLKDLL